ncbi:MAG: alpha/beta hydrolase [Elusimicrobiota bacterium]
MSVALKFAYVLLAAALLWGALRWFERVNLYFPTRQHEIHPGTYGLPYEDVLFQAGDGVPLHGWYLDAGRPRPSNMFVDEPPLPELRRLSSAADKAPVILFFHGNGGNISHRVQKLRIFRQMGLSVFIFDYRGYGKSRGRPSEAGTYRDGRAAAETLVRDYGVEPGRIVYYGESLGCAVAVETALSLPPRAVILDSAFTSTADMGRLILPFLPVRWIIRFRYDSLSKIGRLQAPLLAMHSPDDDIVPFAMGQRLYHAAPEPKRFIETRGNHNDGFLDTPYWGAGIRDFLEAL